MFNTEIVTQPVGIEDCGKSCQPSELEKFK